MKHSIKLILVGFSLIIMGCSSDSEDLSLDLCKQKGYFCYKNINFGKSRGSDYEKGIRDGCKTGEGTFTKDYSLSSTSKDYFDGWILGRSKCKQVLPNEGTQQAEINSRKRAEYQIEQMKLQQSTKSDNSEEGIIDSLLNTSNSSDNSEDVEY